MSNTAVDIFKMFATNEALAKDGVWTPFMGDVSFKIARNQNHAYRKLASRLYKENERLLSLENEAADEKGKEIMRELVSKTILVDWKGDVQYNGESLGEYSVEKAATLLVHEDFMNWVTEVSKSTAKYKQVQDEEDAKN